MTTSTTYEFLCGFALALAEMYRFGHDARAVERTMKAAALTIDILRIAGAADVDLDVIATCMRPEPVTTDPTLPPWGDGNPHPYAPPYCTCRNSQCDGDGGMPGCEYSVDDHERYNTACAAWDLAHGEVQEDQTPTLMASSLKDK